MNFLARAIRFLLWLLVLSWGLRLLRRILSAMFQNEKGSGPRTSEAAAGIPAPTRRLVRDPVCGMHVDETRSIPFRDGGEFVHFCSPACRDQYALKVRKFAANG